jgi:hypothetical protein
VGANVSTRGLVETGDNVMIGGVIVGSNTGMMARVVVRAIGPSLADLGVTGACKIRGGNSSTATE